MSNQGAPGQGQSMNNAPSFDPSLFNAAANANAGSSLPPAMAAALSNAQPSSSNTSLNPAQLQQLTDFHRQQQLRTQPTNLQAFGEQVRKHLVNLGPVERDLFIRQLGATEEGRRYLMQQKALSSASKATAAAGSADTTSSTSMASGSSSRPTPALPSVPVPTSGQSSNAAGPSTISTPEKKPIANIPISQAFNPSLFNTTPANHSQTPQRPQQTTASTQVPPQYNRSIAPTPTPSNPNPTVPSGSSQWSSTQPQYRPSPDYRWQPAPAAPPRRKEDGMRGTMRSELARLMYASGDVENPDTDTIDYMEDLVVDWLADLCAPPPPIRATPSAPYTTPRLDYEVIRHRLSRPSMRKYLDRFEYMEYKAVDMRSARRVARGNFEPLDQKDLDRQLEKGFLDAEDSGQVVDAQNGGQGGKKKRKIKRPPTATATTAGGHGGEGGEKRKPGPKKGWKKGGVVVGSGSGSASRAGSGSVKPEDKE